MAFLLVKEIYTEKGFPNKDWQEMLPYLSCHVWTSQKKYLEDHSIYPKAPWDVMGCQKHLF